METVRRPRPPSGEDGFTIMRGLRVRGITEAGVRFTETEIEVRGEGNVATALDAVLAEPPPVTLDDLIDVLVDLFPGPRTAMLKAKRDARRTWERGE